MFNQFYMWLKLRQIQIFFVMMSILVTFVGLTVGLTDNEAYYWSWSLRPDLSYFDHPPLLAWTLWLTTFIFGKTNLAIRVPALLSFWVCNYLFARWMRRFNIPSQNAVALCISAPLFFVFSWITLPDILFLPLGLLTVDFVSRRRFKAAGFTLGLTILAKWHGLFLIPGIIIAILLIKAPLLKKIKEIVVTLAIAAILQFPVIYWNYQHKWISFKYHLIHRHVADWGTPFVILLKGIGFTSSFIAFGGGAFMYLIYKFMQTGRSRNKFDRDDMVLLAFGMPMLLIFGFSALKGETRIYWSAFAFFPLSIFFLRGLPQTSMQYMQKISVISCFLLMNLLLVSLYLPIGAYTRSIIENFRSYDIRMSPRGDLIGWREWVQQKIAEDQLEGEKVLFLATDFRIASQLMWNSDLDFEQVSVINPIKQYSIWKRPNINHFKKAVFFGDNRRIINQSELSQLCDSPMGLKEFFPILLMSEVIKVIEDMKCNLLISRGSKKYGLNL